jgi:hypothetical protein
LAAAVTVQPPDSNMTAIPGTLLAMVDHRVHVISKDSAGRAIASARLFLY